jgi:PII-like signaling protein
MKLEGKAKLLRIHFGEDDKWEGKPLYEAIVTEGYGASSRIHKAHLLRSSDRPIMVSVIDTEENIKKLLPALDEMVDEGLIAMSEVEVIRYVHQDGVRSPAS